MPRHRNARYRLDALVGGAHAPLLGYALDGHGLYGFEDAGGSGAACVVSGCAGGVAHSDSDPTCVDDCGGGETCLCAPGRWTGDPYCRGANGTAGVCAVAPALDECNGHFGPTTAAAAGDDGDDGGDSSADSSRRLVYHYHSSWTSPYVLHRGFFCFGGGRGGSPFFSTAHRTRVFPPPVSRRPAVLCFFVTHVAGG